MDVIARNEFDGLIEQAKIDVLSNSLDSSTTENSTRGLQSEHDDVRLEPYSGRYKTALLAEEEDEEVYEIYESTLTLNFTPDNNNNNIYKISGVGADKDGETTIKDGFVNHYGKAWWHEKTVNGRLEVLSRGKFDFQQRNFDGTYITNGRKHGQYTSFSAITSS